MFLEKGCLKTLFKFLISYLKYLGGLSLPGDCGEQTMSDVPESGTL